MHSECPVTTVRFGCGRGECPRQDRGEPTMSPAQIRRPRWWLAAGLAAAGVVLLAGCGSAASASSTGTTGGAGAAGSSDTQMDAFSSCLAENGVTLPEPQGGGPEGGRPPGGDADGG